MMFTAQETMNGQPEPVIAPPPGRIGRKILLLSPGDRLFSLLIALEFIVLASVVLFNDAASHRPFFAAASLAGLLASAAAAALTMLLALNSRAPLHTRLILASGQTVMACLLVHLTGGQSGALLLGAASLAVLSIYRDWRVFIPATAIFVTGRPSLCAGPPPAPLI